MKHLSIFGERLTEKSKTYEMMAALTTAASNNKGTILMDGGHPASIPIVNKIWHKRLTEIMSNEAEFDQFISKYYMPVDKALYLIELAKFFNDLYGWNLTEKNIAISNGSQNSYFILFNMLAGESRNIFKKVLFPMTPEYVGYTSQALNENMFVGLKPIIKFTGKHSFKYKVDFNKLMLTKDIAAICLTRPNNPTGNIIADEEVQQLHNLATQNNSYLILDHAYAAPFPNITYKDVKPFWNENVILTYSLSKLGLPSARTGIVIASEEIVRRFSIANLTMSLAVNSLGPTITSPLFANKEIINICNEHIRPYYIGRHQTIQRLILEYFDDDITYYIHEAEGTFFLWLWLKDLPISDVDFFKRLVGKGVLCVPGSYFFGAYKKSWQHRNECIRITYCLNDDKLTQGIKIIAEELKKAYSKHK